MRMAGDSDILQQSNALMQKTLRESEAHMDEIQQRGRDQTQRDVAAAYGQIIPFD